MTNTYFVFVFLTLHLILVDALLLDNINNQQKTTPTSSAHQDTLVFLMQEVIQIKNILQEKTKELDTLRSTVANQSSMIFNLTKELELLMNGRNTSDEIRKLSNEVAVLKFTVDNELANHFQTLTSTNLTEVLSKLHNLENSVRLITIAMNQKVSTSEMAALEQRLSASSVTYITNHETALQSLMKNITERVTALEQDKVIPDKIRLVNGSTHWMGRVEVSYQGAWATVPGSTFGRHYSFDDKAAKVVCRMLGYPTENAAAIHESSPLYFGKGSGRIDMSLYGVHCSGNENTLYDCPHYTNEYPPIYYHKYDIGVACMDVRLVGGSSPSNGRVEVNFGEGWGTVCDDNWNDNDARVVCRMLGYQGSAQGLQGTPTTGGQGIIWLDDVQCTGSETSLAQCRRLAYDIGYAGCGHYEDARVICHN